MLLKSINGPEGSMYLLMDEELIPKHYYQENMMYMCNALTRFSTLTDTWESSRVPEVLQADEQGKTRLTQELLFNTFQILWNNIRTSPKSFRPDMDKRFLKIPASCWSGRLPLQYPRLWLDRGRLHSGGPEVSDAAAGALSLHRPACSRRAPVWCCRCSKSAGNMFTFYQGSYMSLNQNTLFRQWKLSSRFILMTLVWQFGFMLLLLMITFWS